MRSTLQEEGSTILVKFEIHKIGGFNPISILCKCCDADCRCCDPGTSPKDVRGDHEGWSEEEVVEMALIISGVLGWVAGVYQGGGPNKKLIASVDGRSVLEELKETEGAEHYLEELVWR